MYALLNINKNKTYLSSSLRSNKSNETVHAPKSHSPLSAIWHSALLIYLKQGSASESPAELKKKKKACPIYWWNDIMSGVAFIHSSKGDEYSEVHYAILLLCMFEIFYLKKSVKSTPAKKCW